MEELREPTSVYRQLKEVDLSGEKLHQRLPLGPEGLLHGELQNGMKYYIRKSAKPIKRVAVGLAVKVGSLAEEDSEQGVAHIVEHLAFNATEAYNNHDIVRFLERIGAQFGACQNAYTTPDETVYQLVVPSDKASLLDDTISVLAQFAFKIRCAPEDLDKERGAVLEEWRLQRDAAGRTSQAHWKLMMQGSKYADRAPIGLESIIRGVSADTVRGFYECWYRPEHMAVVVVGDFHDAGHVLDMVRRHLGAGHSRSQEPAISPPVISFEPHEQCRCAVFADKEVQDSQVYVSFKHARRKTCTPADYLEHLQDVVFECALNTRLFKLSREIDPPFAMAGASEEPLTATAQMFVLSGMALEGQTLLALQALLTEVARIRCHGFHPSEIARAIRTLEADIENTYLERDQNYCWDIRDEYIRHFLNDEFVTGQEYEARLAKTLLHRVRKEAVEQRAHMFHPHHNCVIKVVEHCKRCNEDDIMQVVAMVHNQEKKGLISDWEHEDIPMELMQVKPQPGAVVSQRAFTVLGATELTLGNGMRVCFKRTAFMEDEVLVTGVATGGLTEVPRDKHLAASMATLIANQLGIFGFRPILLTDMLAGKRVELDITSGAYARNFRGSQSPVDLETAFQLMHLLFTTNVEVDEGELKVVMKLVEQNIEAQLRSPLHHYHNRVRQINYGDCYYFKPLTLEQLAKVDPHFSCTHHNNSYKNPAEFTVVMTGNISEEVLMPLVTTYLASIPATNTPKPKNPKEVTPLHFSFPSEPVEEDVPVPMISPITQSQITFPVELQRATAREELQWLQLACRLLETRLLQQLRFKFGDVYTVSVAPFFGCEAPSNPGNPRGDVSVSFTCDPDNRERIKQMALQEVELLQDAGPSEDEVVTLHNLAQLEFENSQQENSYWHELMVAGYQSKSYQEVQDLDVVYNKNMDARAKVLDSMSHFTLREAMRRLFPYPIRSRYTAITMVPQKPSLLGFLSAGLASLLGSRHRLLLLGAGITVTAAAVAGCRLLWRDGPVQHKKGAGQEDVAAVRQALGQSQRS